MPRGRPPDSGTSREILDAAAIEMAEQGYSGMSMDDVAGRARVSKPTIYSRFPAKRALALAVVDDRSERALAELADAASDELADLLVRYAGAWLDHGLVGVLAGVTCSGPERDVLLSAFTSRTLEPWLGSLRSQLRKRDVDDARTEGLVALALGAALLATLVDQPISPDVMADASRP